MNAEQKPRSFKRQWMSWLIPASLLLSSIMLICCWLFLEPWCLEDLSRSYWYLQQLLLQQNLYTGELCSYDFLESLQHSMRVSIIPYLKSSLGLWSYIVLFQYGLMEQTVYYLTSPRAIWHSLKIITTKYLLLAIQDSLLS